MVRRLPAKGTGFTLVELLIASAVSLVVVIGAGMVFGEFMKVHRRDLARTRLRLQAQLVLSRLTTELHQAGLGVPTGPRASSGDLFPTPIFLANQGVVGFTADLPRPDGSLNGFSYLSSKVPPTSASMVSLLNELNGDCAVGLGASGCDTDAFSLALPPPAALTGGCAASPTAPSCPWSLNKYRTAEKVIVANGMGVWDEFTVGGPIHTSGGGQRGLSLNAAPTFVNAATPNRGFAATPDRVLYRLNGAQVERGQCWGAVGSPPVASAACVGGTDATAWEPLATGVTRFELDYADERGTALTPLPLASPGRARRIHAVLQLTDGPTSATVTAETTLTVRR